MKKLMTRKEKSESFIACDTKNIERFSYQFKFCITSLRTSKIFKPREIALQMKAIKGGAFFPRILRECKDPR